MKMLCCRCAHNMSHDEATACRLLAKSSVMTAWRPASMKACRPSGGTSCLLHLCTSEGSQQNQLGYLSTGVLRAHAILLRLAFRPPLVLRSAGWYILQAQGECRWSRSGLCIAYLQPSERTAGRAKPRTFWHVPRLPLRHLGDQRQFVVRQFAELLQLEVQRVLYLIIGGGRLHLQRRHAGFSTRRL